MYHSLIQNFEFIIITRGKDLVALFKDASEYCMSFPIETFKTFKIGLMKKVVHIQFVYFKVIGVL